MPKNEEVVVIKPQEGKQTLALNLEADIIFCGGSAGSAKTFTLLLRMLKYIDDKDFRAIYFRKNTTQLKGQGGLWDVASELYGKFGANCVDSKLLATFPSGAKCKFSHLDLEKDKESHQGLQYSAIFFDELTHFSETQFTYLCSRLRSKAKTSSFVMASMNPEADTWVLKYVKPFLDEDGFFNEEMAGKLLYFVTINNSPVFAETREELEEKYPEKVYIKNRTTGKMVYIPPKSFTFLGSTIFDNQMLIDDNPNYLAELQSLPEIERMRLLEGNWYAREQGSNYFQRDWLNKVDKVPTGVEVRAWDKAASEPSQKEYFPDFTASIKMIKTLDGNFCIVGDFCPSNGEKEYLGRFRKRAGKRDEIILEQAQWDGRKCKVVLPIDVGSAGKTEYQHSARQLISKGIIVKSDPMPTNKSKIIKFSPFSSAAQVGLISIVESTFPDEKTLNEFYTELEAFTGLRSTRQRKDDWADATATAFNYLNECEDIPTFTLPDTSAPNPFNFN